MRESEAARQQRLAYEKILYRYSTALECGDLDTIITILHTAESDPQLEQMLIEMHQEGYQPEESYMSQSDADYQATPYKDDPIIPDKSQQSPSPLKRMHRPRKRWFMALQNIAAVLVVGFLIITMLSVFNMINKSHISHPKGTTGAGGGVTKQVGNVIVIANLSNNDKITITAMNAQNGAPLWHYELNNQRDINLDLNAKINLAIQDHVVYIAYNKQVQALRIGDGKLLWKTTLGAVDAMMVIGDNPPQLIVDHGLVYVSGYVRGNLYTLDAKTGKIRWHYNAPIPALLAVNNGMAYVLANDSEDQNAVIALSSTNGHELWRYNTPMPLSATIADNIIYVQAAHSLIDDPVGFHKEQKPLFALNAATGKQLWSTIAPANAPSQLVVAQDVLVLYDGNHFCGYHTQNGSPAWCTVGPTANINGAGLMSVQGIVYGIYPSAFTTDIMEAINPQNGSLYWSKNISGVALSPQIISLGNSLILPGSKLVLNRSNGKVLWQIPGDMIMGAAAGN